jgi:hypothetical protein
MPYVIRPPIRKLRASMTLGVAALALAAFPAGASAECLDDPVSPVFQAYGDLGDYFLVPGGNFAAASPDWYMERAKFDTRDALKPGQVAKHLIESRSQSLRMDTESWIVSPPICVDVRRPHFRFFAYKKGGTVGGLNARLLYPGADGKWSVANVGTLSPGSYASWQITPQLELSRLLPIEGNASMQVRFVFDYNVLEEDPAAKGQWFVDELYVDPYRR